MRRAARDRRHRLRASRLPRPYAMRDEWKTMTDSSPEGGGPPLSFKKVDDAAHFERAPAPREPARDSGGPNLAFEAAPRQPAAPATAPDPRTLKTSSPTSVPPASPARRIWLLERGRPHSRRSRHRSPSRSSACRRRPSASAPSRRTRVARSVRAAPGGTFEAARAASFPTERAATPAKNLPGRRGCCPTLGRSAWAVPRAPRTRGLSA